MGIATGVIVGAVFLYSVGKRGRQDILRQDNADLRASNQEMRTEKVGLESTIKEVRAQNNQYREIATQTPAVTQLIDLIKEQQKLSSIQHTEVTSGLTKLTGEITKLARSIDATVKKGVLAK